MRAQFLEALVKKFPNYYQLGQAVMTYYLHRKKKLTKEDCEEKTLKTTFNNN
tara:strand:+ start:487 stop:642 length:156 start_codon:yes stop_codon:yes gene_type:complete